MVLNLVQLVFSEETLLRSGKEMIVKKFAQILGLYEDSESGVKDQRSHQNKGVASFHLLDDIPQKE
jgi:hypothetical protein